MKCTKLRHDTEADAIFELKKCMRKGRTDPERTETSYYQCVDCGWWHLTSYRVEARERDSGTRGPEVWR